MRVLTDHPERAADFVACHVRWQRTSPSALEAVEQRLWQTVGTSGDLWVTEHVADGAARLWRRAIVIGEAPRSQFNALREALGQGLVLDGPTACLALGGERFRGQRGRPWSALHGNLFLTVCLTPNAPATEITPSLIMLPAVAVVDAIRATPGPSREPAIKWVNDILIDGNKVAGVIAASQCMGETLQSAILGIGVNVAAAPDLEPTPFVPRAGSLAEAGATLSLAGFFWQLLAQLAVRYESVLGAGPGPLLSAYRRWSLVVGEHVRIWDESTDTAASPHTWPEPIARGKVVAIESDLSLVIDGCDQPIDKGRLALESACRALGL